MDPRMDRQIDFIIELEGLKSVLRRSYLINGDRLENSAEHSWHICVMAMVLMEHANQPIDLNKTIRMLLIHDIVEIEAGDTYCYDDGNMVEQHQRERIAADNLFGMLPEDQARQLMALWEEFEEAQTPEARFAGAMDRFMPLLQSYFTDGKAWVENEIHKDQVIERNEPISDGSETLWEYSLSLIEEGVNRGWLSQ